MKRIAALFLGLLVLTVVRSDSGEPGGASASDTAGPMERTEDPHWNKNRCDLCHLRNDDASLNPKAFLDPTARANCNRCHLHEDLNEAMHHPYDIKPSRLLSSPGDWPLEQGRLTCRTCHDILRQCDMDLKERWRNPSFLRSEVGKAAVEFCLRCHPEKLYRSASPHDQLDNQGQERAGICLVCHKSRPDPQATGVGAPSSQPANELGKANLKTSIIELCGNCHGVFPHPIGIPHLAVVKEEMLDRMVAKDLSDRYVIPIGQIQRYIAGKGRMPRSMPVDPETHEANCVTCHNPHELGVLPATSPAALGAEGDTPKNYRLRYPRGEICSSCHRI